MPCIGGKATLVGIGDVGLSMLSRVNRTVLRLKNTVFALDPSLTLQGVIGLSAGWSQAARILV